MRQAMRCDPYFPAFCLTWLGHAYFMVGQYDEATVALRRGIERDTTYVPFHLFLAALSRERKGGRREAGCR
ncbi:MAG: hypothetical protein HOK54_08515 [Alphaproteobacteria bacterium]|jgi:hypothetical protein|nr:hypothetical protein [Alphaproteobacteria bacterium]